MTGKIFLLSIERRGSLPIFHPLELPPRNILIQRGKLLKANVLFILPLPEQPTINILTIQTFLILIIQSLVVDVYYLGVEEICLCC